jgi:two-component system phosphate regulon sensor histidine kinase PhoR
VKFAFISNLRAYLKLPEMRSLWFFAVFALVIAAINFVYLPGRWAAASLFILFVLGGVIFWNNLKLARSNLEARASSSRVESIVFNLRDGIVAYDNDFKIVVFNPAAETIFGLRAEEVIGKALGPERAQEPRLRLLAQVIFPSLAPVVVRRSETGSYPQIMDLSFAEPATLELRVATDRIQDMRGAVVGFVKVVHNRTREMELYRSKSEFVTVAAHQLRTPLTAINWIFETLSKSAGIAPADKEVILNGLAASQKLLKIVNDLLDVAKIEEGRFGYEFENVNLIEFIAGILENANIAAKQYGVNLYFDRGSEPSLVVRIDANKLGLALSNLIDNAIRYNVKSGSVTVRVGRVPSQPYVQVSVEDTGVGIPPEAMQKLFTKFFREENVMKFQTEGSGLGLYITKNIINRHGGAIRAESTIGRGTKFFFTLPTDPRLIPPKEVVTGEEL